MKKTKLKTPRRDTTVSRKYNRAVAANAKRKGKVWAWHRSGRVRIVAAPTKEVAVKIAGVERSFCDETFDPVAVETARAQSGQVFEMVEPGAFREVAT